jgi:hypothetical protein
MTDWPIFSLTTALVFVTGYYAWQNRNMVVELQRQSKLQAKLQSYERRAAILRGVLRCLGQVARDGRVKGDVIPGLLEATSERTFLLDRDLCEYLDGLYLKCVEAYTKANVLAAADDGVARATLAAEEAQLVAWLLDQTDPLRQKFIPYLRVDEWPHPDDHRHLRAQEHRPSPRDLGPRKWGRRHGDRHRLRPSVEGIRSPHGLARGPGRPDRRFRRRLGRARRAARASTSTPMIYAKITTRKGKQDIARPSATGAELRRLYSSTTWPVPLAPCGDGRQP